MSRMHRHDRNRTRKDSEARRPPARPSRGAAAIGLPAVRARTGASGRRRPGLAGLSPLTSAPQTRRRPSLATASPSRGGRAQERARSGQEGRGAGGRGETLLLLPEISPSRCGARLGGARAPLPPAPHSGSPSPPPRLPLPPGRAPPPLPLTPLPGSGGGGSRFSRAGDGQSARAAQQLRIRRPPRPPDRKSTRLNSSHRIASRMPSSA